MIWHSENNERQRDRHSEQNANPPPHLHPSAIYAKMAGEKKIESANKITLK